MQLYQQKHANFYLMKFIIPSINYLFISLADILPIPNSRPCKPSPCGINTYCRERSEQAICECLPDFRGDPYIGCYPECLTNSDCPNSQACIKHRCEDPCQGTCGIGALCSVSNHLPVCSCPFPTIGDAFTACRVPEGKF